MVGREDIWRWANEHVERILESSEVVLEFQSRFHIWRLLLLFPFSTLITSFLSTSTHISLNALLGLVVTQPSHLKRLHPPSLRSISSHTFVYPPSLISCSLPMATHASWYMHGNLRAFLQHSDFPLPFVNALTNKSSLSPAVTQLSTYLPHSYIYGLLIVILLTSRAFLGSGPDFPSVRPFVRSSVRPSVRPAPQGPKGQPGRP